MCSPQSLLGLSKVGLESVHCNIGLFYRRSSSEKCSPTTCGLVSIIMQMLCSTTTYEIYFSLVNLLLAYYACTDDVALRLSTEGFCDILPSLVSHNRDEYSKRAGATGLQSCLERLFHQSVSFETPGRLAQCSLHLRHVRMLLSTR